MGAHRVPSLRRQSLSDVGRVDRHLEAFDLNASGATWWCGSAIIVAGRKEVVKLNRRGEPGRIDIGACEQSGTANRDAADRKNDNIVNDQGSTILRWTGTLSYKIKPTIDCSPQSGKGTFVAWEIKIGKELCLIGE